MIITFSSQVPIEANSNNEKFTPFKTFVIENSEPILKKKFIEKNKIPSFPLPNCYICGMHFNNSCQIINEKEGKKWVCKFCGKENLHDQIKKLKAFPKFYDQQSGNCPTEGDDLMDSDIPRLRNLVILVMDFGVQIQDTLIDIKSPTCKEWLNYFIKRDLENYPSNSKFLLILCNSEISIINNDPNVKEPITIGFPEYNDLNYCFDTGRSLSNNLMKCEMNNPKYFIRKLEKLNYKGLSSIGAGFVIALGILEEINPRNHKIIIIGEGSSFFGTCRTIDFEESRNEECIKELDCLYKKIRNPYELNIQSFDRGENRTDNFFLNLKQVFKTIKIMKASRGEYITNISLILEKNVEPQSEFILQVAASDNIVLIPYDNLVVEKNSYNFIENRKIFVMKNVDPKKQFYPFHFEFVAGKALKSPEIIIQVELKVRQEQTVTTFVTTKTLQIIKFQNIKFSFFNFFVSNYCYYANNFFKNEMKRDGLLNIINDYLANKGKALIPILKALKNYIESNCKVHFEVKFQEAELKEMALKAYTKKNEPIDFMNIKRISEKKMIKR